MIDIAKELRKIRKDSGMSQQKIADLIGIPQRTWSGYESGKTTPKMGVLFALAEKGYTIPGLTTGLTEEMAAISKEPIQVVEEKLGLAREMAPMMDPMMDPNAPAETLGKAVKEEYQKRHSITPFKLYRPFELPEGSFVVPLLDQRLSAGPGAALPEADEARALIRVPGYLAQYGENIAALTVDGDSMEPTLHRGDMVVCDSLGWSGEGVYAVRMGGSGFVKRLTKAPGKVVIISDNPKYPVREEPEESEDLQVIGRIHCAITKVE
jgi:phage repressor protein C with HTH and peptisase S24 domain/DNA-binding XRE family transcriptional regulator